VENNKQHITLHVYDEEIEVTINREDEELYRNAAKRITDRYNVYAKAYKGKKSDKTIGLMTLIDIALSYERAKDRNDVGPYNDMLTRLTAEIEETLGERRN